MTRQEIKNIPELVDFMLDKSVLADSRTKVRKRLEEVCDLAIKALEQEPCDKCVYSTKDGYCQYDDITETIPPLESCDEAISKQAVMDCFKKWQPYMATRLYEFKKELSALPPVTPQQKYGEWIKEQTIYGWDGYSYQCSECGRSIHLDTDVENLSDFPYCHCGAKMQESEE